MSSEEPSEQNPSGKNSMNNTIPNPQSPIIESKIKQRI